MSSGTSFLHFVSRRVGERSVQLVQMTPWWKQFGQSILGQAEIAHHPVAAEKGPLLCESYKIQGLEYLLFPQPSISNFLINMFATLPTLAFAATAAALPAFDAAAANAAPKIPIYYEYGGYPRIQANISWGTPAHHRLVQETEHHVHTVDEL